MTGDPRLARLATALLIVGAILSAVVLVAGGGLPAPVLALDLVGGTMLPYGLLALVLPPTRGGSDPGDEDEGGGDGGGGRDVRPLPLPPSGGLQIDWRRFEDEFAAYVHGQLLAAAPA